MSDLPARADIVIVGGGIVGAAAAYALGERSDGDVLLLEARTLGAGATGSHFGDMQHQQSRETEVRLALLASAFWRDFASFTGSAHDFHECGGLVLALGADGLAELAATLPLYERLGLPVELLEPDEAAERAPGLRTRDIAGARYCAGDGVGDPVQALAGLAAAAVLDGARIVEGCAVDALLSSGDRITGVRTARGDVACGQVLLAAGVGSVPLAAGVGVSLPIRPFTRLVLEAKPFPLLAGAPLVVEWESGFAFRARGPVQRFLAPGFGETEARLEARAREHAARRHDAFGALSIGARWVFTGALTPDGRPLAGPVRSVAGLHVAAGFGSRGFSLAPAIGQVIAEGMLEERPSLDIAELAPERFAGAR